MTEMTRIAVYGVADGQVRRFCLVKNPDAQAGPDEAVRILGEGEAPDENASLYRVVGGNLVKRQEIVLSCDKPTFTANGVDRATITLVGIVGSVSLRVSPGPVVSVAESDPVLVLTSDSPRRFRLDVDDPLHYGNPVTVEAR